jgi:multiple sugar transport system permease protein
VFTLASQLLVMVLGNILARALMKPTGPLGRAPQHRIFLTYLIPSTLLFIPFSRLVSLLGLQNSHWALILIYPTFTVSFCTWLLMGFFKSLPKEIEESAMVDGCSRTVAIGRIVLPLAVSGPRTVVIFAHVHLLRREDDRQRGGPRRAATGARSWPPA